MKYRIREIIVVAVFLFPGSTWASQLLVIESKSAGYTPGDLVETMSLVRLAEGETLELLAKGWGLSVLVEKLHSDQERSAFHFGAMTDDGAAVEAHLRLVNGDFQFLLRLERFVTMQTDAPGAEIDGSRQGIPFAAAVLGRP